MPRLGRYIREPTAGRLHVYQFLVAYMRSETWAPSLDEIVSATGLAKTTVKYHLQRLERDQLIERGPGYRQIRFPEGASWNTSSQPSPSSPTSGFC